MKQPEFEKNQTRPFHSTHDERQLSLKQLSIRGIQLFLLKTFYPVRNTPITGLELKLKLRKKNKNWIRFFNLRWSKPEWWFEFGKKNQKSEHHLNYDPLLLYIHTSRHLHCWGTRLYKITIRGQRRLRKKKELTNLTNFPLLHLNAFCFLVTFHP